MVDRWPHKGQAGIGLVIPILARPSDSHKRQVQFRPARPVEKKKDGTMEPETTPTTTEPTTTPTKHEQKPQKAHKTRRQDHEDRALDALKAGGKVSLGQASRPVLTHNERVSLEDLPAKVKDFVDQVKADNIGLANIELSIYWKPQWKPSPTGKDISIHYAVLP